MDFSDEDMSCPLCLEEMDSTDRKFQPCHCGYQICLWCWHHIMEMAAKDGLEGRCPACRSQYDKEKIVSATPNDQDELPESGVEKKQKFGKGKPKAAAGGGLGGQGGSSSTLGPDIRKQLANVRVVQRNLVYVVGMPYSLADEETLQRKEYFGQYGKVLKIAVSRSTSAISNATATVHGPTANVYVTYFREEDAVRCIQAVDGCMFEGRILRACFGTTKYCNAWLKNLVCPNPDCLYLHEVGTQEDSYTKDEMGYRYNSGVTGVAGVTGLTAGGLGGSSKHLTNLDGTPKNWRAANGLPPPPDSFVVQEKHPAPGYPGAGGASAPRNPSGISLAAPSVVKGFAAAAGATSGGILPPAASWGAKGSTTAGKLILTTPKPPGANAPQQAMANGTAAVPIPGANAFSNSSAWPPPAVSTGLYSSSPPTGAGFASGTPPLGSSRAPQTTAAQQYKPSAAVLSGRVIQASAHAPPVIAGQPGITPPANAESGAAARSKSPYKAQEKQMPRKSPPSPMPSPPPPNTALQEGGGYQENVLSASSAPGKAWPASVLSTATSSDRDESGASSSILGQRMADVVSGAAVSLARDTSSASSGTSATPPVPPGILAPHVGGVASGSPAGKGATLSGRGKSRLVVLGHTGGASGKSLTSSQGLTSSTVSASSVPVEKPLKTSALESVEPAACEQSTASTSTESKSPAEATSSRKGESLGRSTSSSALVSGAGLMAPPGFGPPAVKAPKAEDTKTSRAKVDAPSKGATGSFRRSSQEDSEQRSSDDSFMADVEEFRDVSLKSWEAPSARSSVVSSIEADWKREAEELTASADSILSPSARAVNVDAPMDASAPDNSLVLRMAEVAQQLKLRKQQGLDVGARSSKEEEWRLIEGILEMPLESRRSGIGGNGVHRNGEGRGSVEDEVDFSWDASWLAAAAISSSLRTQGSQASHHETSAAAAAAAALVASASASPKDPLAGWLLQSLSFPTNNSTTKDSVLLKTGAATMAIDSITKVGASPFTSSTSFRGSNASSGSRQSRFSFARASDGGQVTKFGAQDSALQQRQKPGSSATSKFVPLGPPPGFGAKKSSSFTDISSAASTLGAPPGFKVPARQSPPGSQMLLQQGPVLTQQQASEGSTGELLRQRDAGFGVVLNGDAASAAATAAVAAVTALSEGSSEMPSLWQNPPWLAGTGPASSGTSSFLTTFSQHPSGQASQSDWDFASRAPGGDGSWGTGLAAGCDVQGTQLSTVQGFSSVSGMAAGVGTQPPGFGSASPAFTSTPFSGGVTDTASASSSLVSALTMSLQGFTAGARSSVTSAAVMSMSGITGVTQLLDPTSVPWLPEQSNSNADPSGLTTMTAPQGTKNTAKQGGNSGAPSRDSTVPLVGTGSSNVGGELEPWQLLGETDVSAGDPVATPALASIGLVGLSAAVLPGLLGRTASGKDVKATGGIILKATSRRGGRFGFGLETDES